MKSLTIFALLLFCFVAVVGASEIALSNALIFVSILVPVSLGLLFSFLFKGKK